MIVQGGQDPNLKIQISYNSESMHFWPHIGTAKQILAMKILLEKL